MINIKDHKIIAIVPAYNEAGKIGVVVSKIIEEANGLIQQIVVVDDGSEDSTGIEAKNNKVVVLRHDVNQGAGAAIRTGIDYALQNKFSIAIVLGGDNQDSPIEIKRLIMPIIYDHFDFVQGSRYMPGGHKIEIPLFRWITTGIYSLLFKVITRFPITDGTNGFRAFSLSIFKNKNINIWQSWLNRYELEPYLYYKVIENDLKVTEAPVTKSYPKGNSGFTKMEPFISWWSILRPIILLKLKIKK